MSWPGGEPTESERRLGLGLLLGLVALGCAAQIFLAPRELSAVPAGDLPHVARTARPASPRAATRPQHNSLQRAPLASTTSRAGLAMPRPASYTSPPTVSAPPPARRPPAPIASAPIPEAQESAPPVKPRASSRDPSLVEVLGPDFIREGDEATFLVRAARLRDAAQATVRLFYNSDVLEFLSAEEGDLFSTDDGVTQFLASTTQLPGHVDLVVSRLPGSGGISGTGIVCVVKFLSLRPGGSPIGTAGSRLLDAEGAEIPLDTRDAAVIVR